MTSGAMAYPALDVRSRPMGRKPSCHLENQGGLNRAIDVQSAHSMAGKARPGI